MLEELFERQSAIQAIIDKYTPTREAFEKFLRGGQKNDEGYFLNILLPLSVPGIKSRYSWKKRAAFDTSGWQKVVVEAFTDPTRRKFGYTAGDIPKALIDVKVSLPENPDVVQGFELPPAWAILEQGSVFSPLVLEKLEKDLEEIVPLVRACLPQE